MINLCTRSHTTSVGESLEEAGAGQIICTRQCHACMSIVTRKEENRGDDVECRGGLGENGVVVEEVKQSRER